MSPDYWQKIKLILDEALERTPRARAAYLAERCGANQTLRRDVESLLAFENYADDALEASALALMEDLKIPENNFVGKTFGVYKILEKIGAGGMGAVFLAERDDGEFRQTVAVKLIRSGIASEAVLRRFLNERQILAELEHPNIARLIDGGTSPDGTPFLAMEYVEGLPIDEYADQKDLSLTERLNLFRRVGAAVSHAHKNLVIHRDLKPSNILVSDDGEPKLLDFGIAKLLKNDAGETQTRQFAFTPDYASPEQMRGEKLTTGTDVYSLGVILYELLTGARPYRTDSGNLGEVVRIVCETEPERPSSVVRRPSSVVFRSLLIADGKLTDENKGHRTKDDKQIQNPKSKIQNPKSLRGDLDNIILKSLRKEPERRYQSVEQFSEDLRRHLVGLPVTASKDTLSYRAAKFAQRNRVGVAAAILVLITLLVGLAATLYQVNVARRERAKAEQRFDDVRALANSFLFEFHDAIQSLSGATPARKLVVSRAVEYLDKLAGESNNDPALQRELGAAYERIGKIQGNSYFSNLGDTEGAMKSYRRSLEIRRKLADSDPANRELQYDLAISQRGVGDMFYTMDDLPNGLQCYETALAVLENLAAAEPDNLKFRSSLTDVISRRGDIKGMVGFSNLGDISGALENYAHVVRLSEGLIAADPENEGYQGDYATRLLYLGKLQTATGDVRGAIASGRKSVAILESLAAANPDDAAYKSRLMTALNALRVPLLENGQTAEAIENARRAAKTLEQMTAEDSQNGHLRRSLGVSYYSLGACLMRAKDVPGAVENFRRAISIAEQLAVAEPKNADHRRDLAAAEKSLSEARSARPVPTNFSVK